MQNFQTMGENSGIIVSRWWSKVHESLGRCGGPFVVFNAVSRLSVSFAHRRYWPSKLPLSCKVIENRSTVSKNFYGSLLPWFTPYPLYIVAKFGWVQWSELRVRKSRGAIKKNAEFSEGGWKLRSNFKPFVDQSSCCFEKR